MKRTKKYWCVEGEITDITQEYVTATNKKQAIKKAQDQMGEWFNEEPCVDEISKKEYEENI